MPTRAPTTPTNVPMSSTRPRRNRVARSNGKMDNRTPKERSLAAIKEWCFGKHGDPKVYGTLGKAAEANGLLTQNLKYYLNKESVKLAVQGWSKEYEESEKIAADAPPSTKEDLPTDAAAKKAAFKEGSLMMKQGKKSARSIAREMKAKHGENNAPSRWAMKRAVASGRAGESPKKRGRRTIVPREAETKLGNIVRWMRKMAYTVPKVIVLAYLLILVAGTVAASHFVGKESNQNNWYHGFLQREKTCILYYYYMYNMHDLWPVL